MIMKIAILGYGNIGRAAEQAVLTAPDMELAGIFHHDEIDQILNQSYIVHDSFVHEIDAVIVCTPSRDVPHYASSLLERGICTVDSFDIHTQIPALRQRFMALAKDHQAVSVLAAGWDPGTDSVVRCLMEAMAPQGLTYTNFGPGRSMGHTVAAKAIKGVKDALSMTIPLGTGIHRRMVYIELEPGADFKTVEAALLADDYFAHDETHVIPVASVADLNNVAHGVNLVRNGVSGTTHNQRMDFNMTINNPALTGQILVSCARAAVRLKQEGRFGAYTLPELAPISLLPGSPDDLIAHLV